MTNAEKLTMLKSNLHITGSTKDAELSTYLNFAKMEIMGWMYGDGVPDNVINVPARYEAAQIMACVAGYSLSGAENEQAHSENGISRTFKYSDMVDYIRAHVLPYAVVV
jgi:hypothetical protein